MGYGLGLLVAVAVSLVVPRLVVAQTPEINQLSISSDLQEANTKTGNVLATGNVRIEYPARRVVATADKAIYYRKERKIVLTGNARAIQDKNRITAETLTYLLNAGVFQATPKEKGQQVTAIYTVPQDEVQDSTPSTPK